MNLDDVAPPQEASAVSKNYFATAVQGGAYRQGREEVSRKRIFLGKEKEVSRKLRHKQLSLGCDGHPDKIRVSYQQVLSLGCESHRKRYRSEWSANCISAPNSRVYEWQHSMWWGGGCLIRMCNLCNILFPIMWQPKIPLLSHLSIFSHQEFQAHFVIGTEPNVMRHSMFVCQLEYFIFVAQ